MRSLFATQVYQAPLGAPPGLIDALSKACVALVDDDDAGRRWSEDNAYLGYTSYASLNDLPWRDPDFRSAADLIDAHVKRFAEMSAFDLQGRPLILDSFWANVLPEGAGHSGHIHPHSVISGTLYVQVPPGASPIRFEDPRLPMMMCAPPRRADAEDALKPFVYLHPKAGEVVLWDSWLRHEVPPHAGEDWRISLSFNYRWGP